MMVFMSAVRFVPVVTWEKAVAVVEHLRDRNGVSAPVLFRGRRRTGVEQRCAFTRYFLGRRDRRG